VNSVYLLRFISELCETSNIGKRFPLAEIVSQSRQAKRGSIYWHEDAKSKQRVWYH